MIFVLKSTVYFIVIFLILSIPINHRPLFSHAYELTAPHTDYVYYKVEAKVMLGLNKTKKLGLKLFSNISPNEEIKRKRDSVSYTASGVKTKETLFKQNHQFSDEEKAILRRIIKKGE